MELEERIGYHFKNKELLTVALTHSSYAKERKAQHIDPKLPGKRRRKVPESVRRALLKGMAIRQEDRYASVEELITALDVQENDSSAGRTVMVIAAILIFLVLALSLAVGFLM